MGLKVIPSSLGFVMVKGPRHICLWSLTTILTTGGTTLVLYIYISFFRIDQEPLILAHLVQQSLPHAPGCP
jgi:hypothetical protein